MVSFSPQELYLSGWSLALWLPLSGVIIQSPTNFRSKTGDPPQIGLFPPNRTGLRPLEQIATQGTTRRFYLYPFIKFPATDMTTRYPQSREIEDLSVIWWLQGTANLGAPPNRKLIWDFGLKEPVRVAVRDNCSTNCSLDL